MLAKRFPGGQLVLTGANSAVGLRSMPARWLFLDEVDAYPGDLEGEGDPVALAEARTDSFGHRRKSSWPRRPRDQGAQPDRAGVRIDRPAPLSRPLPALRRAAMAEVPAAALGKRAAGNGGLPLRTLRGADRRTAQDVDDGRGERAAWLPTAAPDVQASAETAGVIGFHISGLYSPLGWLSWEEIARRWDQAQGNDSALKTVKNTRPRRNLGGTGRGAGLAAAL